MIVKIEKGIPIPKRQVRKSKWRDICEKMKPGDSIFFKNPYEASSFRSAASMLGIKITQRKVNDGIRIWRIK